MTTVHLHHGILTNGKKSTDRLEEPLTLRGHDVNNPDFPGFATPHSANWFASRYSKRLSKMVEAGDHAIGHSHGCLVLLECMRRGAQFDTVIFIAAAVDTNVIFPAWGFKRLINIHNPKDVALLAGKFLRNNKMGALGREGYDYAELDPRVQNVERLSRKGKFNHTKPYFEGEGLEWTVNLCDRWLK